MAVSLDDIDAAIMAALAPLWKTTSTPDGIVNLLDRWAGEINTVEGVHSEVMGKLPAILVGLEGEVSSPITPSKQVSGKRETVHRSTWAVLVATQELRSDKRALKGVTGARGVYALSSAVQARLNNLFVSGTYRDIPLMYLDTRPYFVKRGVVYVQAVRFTADRVVADADYTDNTIVDFDEFQADVNREGQIDEGGTSDPQNPRNQILAHGENLELPLQQQGTGN